MSLWGNNEDWMSAASIRGRITQFRESSHPVVSLVRDLIWVIMVVVGIALALFLVSGTWPAVVTVESESMVPNLNVGDLVLVVEENRFAPLNTWEEGMASGYSSFGDFGDVIIYRPNGIDAVHPIIHRAMYWMEGGEERAISIQVNNMLLNRNYTAPHEGYITKGDHNPNIDQVGAIQGIGPIEPVKKDWVVGKALLAIPLLGYPALYIREFAVLIVVLLILHELYLSWKGGNESSNGKKAKTKKKR